MIKGDKIRLIQPMGVFKNVGEICEVVDITEGGIISFKFGNCHLGCMSYDEYVRYFEPYNENQSKREWSSWEYYEEILYCTIFGNTIQMQLSTRNNGKKIQVRTRNPLNTDRYITAESSCSPSDVFDEKVGLRIAKHRLSIKLAQIDLEEYINKM